MTILLACNVLCGCGSRSVHVVVKVSIWRLLAVSESTRLSHPLTTCAITTSRVSTRRWLIQMGNSRPLRGHHAQDKSCDKYVIDLAEPHWPSLRIDVILGCHYHVLRAAPWTVLATLVGVYPVLEVFIAGCLLLVSSFTSSWSLKYLTVLTTDVLNTNTNTPPHHTHTNPRTHIQARTSTRVRKKIISKTTIS